MYKLIVTTHVKTTSVKPTVVWRHLPPNKSSVLIVNIFLLLLTSCPEEHPLPFCNKCKTRTVGSCHLHLFKKYSQHQITILFLYWLFGIIVSEQWAFSWWQSGMTPGLRTRGSNSDIWIHKVERGADSPPAFGLICANFYKISHSLQLNQSRHYYNNTSGVNLWWSISRQL